MRDKTLASVGNRTWIAVTPIFWRCQVYQAMSSTCEKADLFSYMLPVCFGLYVWRQNIGCGQHWHRLQYNWGRTPNARARCCKWGGLVSMRIKCDASNSHSGAGEDSRTTSCLCYPAQTLADKTPSCTRCTNSTFWKTTYRLNICMTLNTVCVLNIFCFAFYLQTSMCTHRIHNSTVFITALCFGDYIAIVRECNTPSYLKHVQIWYIYCRNIYFIISDIRSNVYMISDAVKPGKVVYKGKVLPRTGHEGPEGE
jgi:hypothetical protein